jgi:hypothetical protein
MFASTDYTAIALAVVGLIGTCVTVWAAVRTKQIEAKAAEDARRAAQSEKNAKTHADSVLIKPKKRKKPPEHPCT